MGVASVFVILLAFSGLMTWSRGQTVWFANGMSNQVGILAAGELGRWQFAQDAIDSHPGLEEAVATASGPIGGGPNGAGTACYDWVALDDEFELLL